MKSHIQLLEHSVPNPILSHFSSKASLLGALLLCLMASPAEAASNLTNSLTSYNGTSQDNYPGQPAFLTGEGLDVAFVWGGGAGAWERIGFNASGATFGGNTPSGNGNGDGRNYLRTVDDNYAPISFTAYVTVNRASRQSVFFGIGSGNLGSFKAPDIGSGNASVFLELQDGYDNGSRRVLGGTAGTPTNVEVGYDGMTTVTGLMRLRMDYDAVAKTVTYAIDYAPSGAFVADQTFPAVDVSSIAPEWTGGEKSRIYFGGQGYVNAGNRIGITFTDFLVTTAAVPPGSIDHFHVAAASPQTAGAVFDVTITGEDINHATVNDSTTTVTLNSPTGGSLMEFDWNRDGVYGDNSGLITNGVAIIKARNKKAQTVSIVALGGIGTTTTPPDVTTTADVFTKLQILAPGESAAPGTPTGKIGTPRDRIINRAFNVTVNAVDANWNLVNTVYDNVGITTTDVTANLPADALLVDGTNTFAVTLNTVGTFTVTATNLVDSNIASGNTAVRAFPVLVSSGTWKSLPIIPTQTPDTAGWSTVPAASITNLQGTANWDVKQIKVCNDATNVYFLVELWPGSTVSLITGNMENYFWFDTDNDPATGYLNADETSVGAESVLDAWQVWTSGMRQAFWWGVSGLFYNNANVVGPGGNPNNGWPADNGLFYEYSMSMTATNSDGSLIFPSNSVTMGFGSRQAGSLKDSIPAFSYSFAPLGPGQISMPVSGTVNITFHGIPNRTNIVQTTTNLSSPWWNVSTNVVSANGTWQFTDTNATKSQQFYRAVTQ